MPGAHCGGRWQKAPGRRGTDACVSLHSGGARGLDMGRNIFQSEHSVEMAQAIRKIVHEGFTDKEAWEFFQDAIH